MRKTLLWLGLLLALGIPNLLIVQKEQVLRQGTVVLLELAPVDPRSLMQGDYMDLRYGIELAERGVITLDPQGVARLVRLDDGTPLAPGELYLSHRTARSFFFQEGQADHFAEARYGELRLASDGSSVLVGLRDKERQKL